MRTTLAKATTALKAIEKVWRSETLEVETKKKALQTCIFSTLLYACEVLVVTKAIIEQRIIAFERKCYRKILRIGWTQKVKNTDYRRIGLQLKENVMQELLRRKFGLFGHMGLEMVSP